MSNLKDIYTQDKKRNDTEDASAGSAALLIE